MSEGARAVSSAAGQMATAKGAGQHIAYTSVDGRCRFSHRFISQKLIQDMSTRRPWKVDGMRREPLRHVATAATCDGRREAECS
jgi:hypothetical protein